MRPQRIQDSIHGLISFDGSDEEQRLWRLIDTPEFQRLRRIKQLGFSDLVYPGATHTRFAHSLGAFHIARRLIGIVRRKVGEKNNTGEYAALCAALLHDIGHGPFSHAFEHVEKARGHERKHEDWTVEILTGPTETNEILSEVSTDLPNVISQMIKGEAGRDILGSIVSSQFDADRMDYLRRDRYMTGIGSGHFDFEWLLDCLEVGELTVTQGDNELVNIQGLYLNHKGHKAAEGYLQARFQMYSMVYMHKTTRAAERMLSALLGRLSALLQDGSPGRLGISAKDPVVMYLRQTQPALGAYSTLDDCAVTASLHNLAGCKDTDVADLARRLLDRRLYKCFDVGAMRVRTDQARLRFQKTMRERAKTLELETGLTLLEDDGRIGGYTWYDWESENALKKVLVSDSEQNENREDIYVSSAVVQALAQEPFYRVYVPDIGTRDRLRVLWEEVTG